MSVFSSDPKVRAAIDSFRQRDYSVAAMERDGFTHVGAECLDCRAVVHQPLRRLREKGLVGDDTTLADIAKGYKCSQCGGREMNRVLPQPSYQYMGTPADQRPDSPVNRALRAK